MCLSSTSLLRRLAKRAKVGGVCSSDGHKGVVLPDCAHPALAGRPHAQVSQHVHTYQVPAAVPQSEHVPAAGQLPAHCRPFWMWQIQHAQGHCRSAYRSCLGLCFINTFWCESVVIDVILCFMVNTFYLRPWVSPVGLLACTGWFTSAASLMTPVVASFLPSFCVACCAALALHLSRYTVSCPATARPICPGWLRELLVCRPVEALQAAVRSSQEYAGLLW